MGLLDLWVAEALEATPPAQTVFAPAPACQGQAVVQANGLAARREVEDLIRRKLLFADETQRLSELAQELGLQVVIQRLYLNGGEAEMLTLTATPRSVTA